MEAQPSYRLLRIDFTDDQACAFCPNRLTTGIGRVLVDDAGNEVFAGPVCAKKNARNAGEKVPNLTLASLEPEAAKPTPTSPSGDKALAKPRAPRVSDEEVQRQHAISYLLLRAEKLSAYKGMCFGRLQEVYERYRARGLSENDQTYLQNLMAKVERERPEYSYANLQALYACHFWIERFLGQENSDFIRGLRHYLRSNLYLKPAQIEGLNKWFERREGMISIKSDAFQLPDES